MTVSNPQEAVNEISALINTAWATQGTGFPIHWEDVSADEIELSEGQSACKVYIRHATSVQATLSNQDGVRRWTQTGTILCQIRSLPGQGLSVARASATILQAALRGASTPSGVWFRDVRQNERLVDDGWARIDVLATFEYDEVN